MQGFGIDIALAAVTAEEATFQDPWSGVYEFTIRRRDSEAHQAWLKSADPFATAFQRHLAAETARRIGRSEVKQIPAAGAEVIDVGSAPQIDDGRLEIMEAVLSKVADRIDAGELPADVLTGSLGGERLRREAQALVVSAKGPGGELSDQQIAGLLSTIGKVPEGNYGAGRGMGEVLTEWVLARSDEQATAAQRLFEDSAKNSPAPSVSH